MRKLLLSVIVLGGVACGPSLGPCKPEYTTEMQTMGQQIVKDICRDCHDSSVTGDDRNKAPKDLNYDTLDLVRSHAGEMYSEVAGGDMPPKDSTEPRLIQSDKDNVRAWLACGAQPLLADF